MNLRGAWSLMLASSILAACVYTLPNIDESRDCDATSVDPCDAGTTSDAEVCGTNCPIADCGDGVITAPEECDDGNEDDLDTCNNLCRNNVCGDQRTTQGEECDDGNSIPGDGCDPNCTMPRCGNGFRTSNEICDDGNTVDGDDCNSTCSLEGISSLFVGKPGEGGVVDGIGENARLRGGHYMALAGNIIYIANDRAVRAVNIDTRQVTTIAGADTNIGYMDSAVGTSAIFSDIRGLTTDGSTIWAADIGNHVIRAISTTSPYAVTTVAGYPEATASPIPIVDGGPSVARLDSPRGLAYLDGKVYFIEPNAAVIRVFDPADSSVSIVAGLSGTHGTTDGTGSGALFQSPRHLLVGGPNLLYVSDTGGYKLRALDVTTKKVTTIAGTATCGYSDGPATSSNLYDPRGMTLQGQDLYFTEEAGHTIRHIRLDTLELSTLSGTPASCMSTCMCGTLAGTYLDGKPAEAKWNAPYDLVYYAPKNWLIVSDGGNHVLRVIK